MPRFLNLEGLRRLSAPAVLAGWLALAAACNKESSPEAVAAGASVKPKEAATQLQQAFASAPVEVQQTAKAASQALRAADYEAAVKNIQEIKAKPNLSVEQGMAIHSSEQALEARLIAAMEAGDPRAKQAYEQLRKSRRN